MNAQMDQTQAQQQVPAPGRSAIGAVFDAVVSTALCVLLAAGLIALTLTWRSSDLEFIADNELRVTRTTWWGWNEKVTRLEASSRDGWQIIGDDNVRVPLRNRALRLED